MEDQSFRRLLLRVRNDRGLDLSAYKQPFIMRRLRSRFRALDICNLDEYCMVLRRNPEEYEKLIEALAINVTEFFRDPTLFELLSKEIIKEICRHKTKPGTKNLRFLCAGGASGEEAYSIAIALCETLGSQIDDYTISIHSIDIDDDCIRKTKAGVYIAERVRNVPIDLLDKYFTKDEGNLYIVKPILKKMVRTYHMDILTARIPRHFDVIFCRNLLIYFSKEAHVELFLKFHSAIITDGFLILGRTETLIGATKGMYEVFDAKERVYRKITIPNRSPGPALVEPNNNRFDPALP